MKKELSIIPVPYPRLIPKYLLDQVKDRTWTTEAWYDHQTELIGVDSNIVLAFIDRNHEIKGFIWLTIDNFDGYVYINTLSVDPQYQRKSKLINFVTRYIRELAKALGIERVLWSAKRAKALTRYGFQESEYRLMEAKV